MDSHVQEAAQEGLQMSPFVTAHTIVHLMANHIHGVNSDQRYLEVCKCTMIM
jgi:hypothetical protein